MIDQTLYDAFGQRQVATIYTATNQYKVVLEVQPQYQHDPNLLSEIYVSGPGGAQVPLSSFAHFTRKTEPLLISHQGIFPAVTLSFNLAPGVALGQAVDAIQAMTERLHVPPTLNASFQGTAQAFQASLSSMPLLVAAAILVVYIVLGDPLRELHPPDHDPVGPAVGRRRRAVDADAAALRAVGHRDRRHHPADRHRQEERDHDDRLRAAGRAAGRQEPAGGDPSGLPACASGRS